jgi:hypothetical protein
VNLSFVPFAIFASSNMKDIEEQCVCVKLYLKLAETFIETFQMFKQAYGEDCLSCTQCYKWYQRFKSGKTCTENDPKTGQPSTLTDEDHVEKVHPVIRENNHLTVREVSEEVGMSKSLRHFF